MNIPDTSRIHPEYIPNTYRIHHGYIPDTSQIHPRYIPDTSRIHPGYILDTSRKYPSQILNTCQIHPFIYIPYTLKINSSSIKYTSRIPTTPPISTEHTPDPSDNISQHSIPGSFWSSTLNNISK